jgi:hypothetical protein
VVVEVVAGGDAVAGTVPTVVDGAGTPVESGATVRPGTASPHPDTSSNISASSPIPFGLGHLDHALSASTPELYAVPRDPCRDLSGLPFRMGLPIRARSE